MLSNLPIPPDPTAPSFDEKMEYQNQLQFLNTIAKNVKSDFVSNDPVDEHREEAVVSPVLLPQGPALTKETMSKQIVQKATVRAIQSQREQLFGTSGAVDTVDTPDQDFDKLLALHRDQQEKVAEEMLSMTQRLKEQSLAAKSIVQDDTSRIDKINQRADENLSKLQNEGGRISKLASRWNCRCWIWLAMLIVLLTFVGMVLLMKLFKKKLPPPSAHTEL